MSNTQLNKLTFRQHLQAVKAALFLLNHKHELKRLIVWAENKRRRTRARHFAAIGNSYKERHAITEQKIFFIRRCHPKHYWLAYCLHQISNLLSVKPAYHRGLASSRHK